MLPLIDEIQLDDIPLSFVDIDTFINLTSVPRQDLTQLAEACADIINMSEYASSKGRKLIASQIVDFQAEATAAATQPTEALVKSLFSKVQGSSLIKNIQIIPYLNNLIAYAPHSIGLVFSFNLAIGGRLHSDW
jgi:hypothetical protein